MARIRTLRLSMFDPSAASIEARYLYLGLTGMADDEGRLEADLRVIADRVFPDFEVVRDDLVTLIAELEQAGLVDVYGDREAGRMYLRLPRFATEQTINRPQLSKLPQPGRYYPLRTAADLARKGSRRLGIAAGGAAGASAGGVAGDPLEVPLEQLAFAGDSLNGHCKNVSEGLAGARKIEFLKPSVSGFVSTSSLRSESETQPSSGSHPTGAADKTTKQQLRSQQISELFDYWKRITGRDSNPRVKLTKDRRSTLNARLVDGYSVEDLKAVMDAKNASAWHNGSNDRGQVYNDIDNWLGSTKKVQKVVEALAPGGNGSAAGLATAERVRMLAAGSNGNGNGKGRRTPYVDPAKLAYIAERYGTSGN